MNPSSMLLLSIQSYVILPFSLCYVATDVGNAPPFSLCNVAILMLATHHRFRFVTSPLMLATHHHFRFVTSLLMLATHHHLRPFKNACTISGNQTTQQMYKVNPILMCPRYKHWTWHILIVYLRWPKTLFLLLSIPSFKVRGYTILMIIYASSIHGLVFYK